MRWRSGESARLPPMWPGFDSGPVHVWVEFVVGYRPCSEGFLRVLRFSSLHKNQHFQISIRSGISGIKKSHLVKDPTVNSHLFYYLFYFVLFISKKFPKVLVQYKFIHQTIKQLFNSVFTKYRVIKYLLATDKSRYFAQPRPIIVNSFLPRNPSYVPN